MSQTQPLRIFFTGTDTEVGKTYAAALLAKAYLDCGLSVGVYKPVASGCIVDSEDLISEDAAKLWHAAGQPRSLADVCPQRFQAPLVPCEAARAEGKTVDPGLLRSGAGLWQDGNDLLIIEGAGGLMSPLADGILNIDLVKQFSPTNLILVAANRLGAIHQTLATCAAAQQHGVAVTGIILSDTEAKSDPSAATNADQIQRYIDVPLLWHMKYGTTSVPASVTTRLLQQHGCRNDSDEV